jgi:tight adherence protein B
MSLSVLILLVLAAGLATAGYGWLAVRRRRTGLASLDRAMRPPREAGRRSAPLHPFPPRYRWLPPLLGAIVCGGVLIVLAPPFAIGAGVLTGMLAYVIERAIAEARTGRIEQQLANALDLVVAAVQAGGALMGALEAALAESKPPIRPFLLDVVTRLQLGDAPEVILKDLAARVPIETFRLFAVTLAVHWEVGGSLASTLAVVARTVRDRAELSRRIRTQAAEAQFSVAVVMLLTYAVAILMWRANPDPVVRFFLSPVGAELTGGVIVLQAIGLFWMSQISDVEF